jgi:hypothetical protein
MQGPTRDRLMELCDKAATEQDAARFQALVDEIFDLLKRKTGRLKANASHVPAARPNDHRHS